MAETPATPLSSAREPWTHPRFFALLRELGRLRVIHRSGPSTFESLCTMGPHGFADGHMNAINDLFHWHVKLDAFGYLRSQDTTHARSGRRVLFFEMREREDSAPFAFVYLHRDKGEQYEFDREQRFLAAHHELKEGRALERAKEEVR